MVKHTQTIRRQQLTDCLSVVYRFVGLALKGLTDQKPQAKVTIIFMDFHRTSGCFPSIILESDMLPLK